MAVSIIIHNLLMYTITWDYSLYVWATHMLLNNYKLWLIYIITFVIINSLLQYRQNQCLIVAIYWGLIIVDKWIPSVNMLQCWYHFISSHWSSSLWSLLGRLYWKLNMLLHLILTGQGLKYFYVKIIDGSLVTHITTT